MRLTGYIIIAAFILNLILPWWSIAIPGLIFGFLLKPKPLAAFGLGFLALFLLWSGHALYIHIANNGVLSTRIADMFGLGQPLLIVLLTGVVGGLVCGLAALTGALFVPREGKRRFTR